MNYTAVLEIPKINLKEGIVDVTNGFKSIKYAISADSNGNYPNINGNFILYAHSGNSSIAFFKNLYKLNLNDNIYHYIVFNKYDIEKTGKAKVTNSNKEKYITLITCNQQRKGYQIIIEGKLIDESNY